jgi:phytoene synthase
MPAQSNVLMVQYRSFKDLYLYCYHVASVVGLVCIKIFGYRNPEAERLAERCGVAFQLTNIIRDVKEDAELGRVYLPLEDLQKYELNPLDLQKAPDPSRLRPLLAMEADRARDFYVSGHELIPYVSEDSQPALWVLVTIYEKLLEKIRRKQFDVYGGRISLTTFEKIKVLGKGFLKRLT